MGKDAVGTITAFSQAVEHDTKGCVIIGWNVIGTFAFWSDEVHYLHGFW
jgi:hypothetical protein